MNWEILKYNYVPAGHVYICTWELNIAQAVEHSAIKVCILLYYECICSLGYLPFQPVVHNWSIKGCGMGHAVFGNDPLLLIGKSSLCGESGFPLKKYVTMAICLTSNSWCYETQCVREVSLNKTNFLYIYIYIYIYV